MRHVVHESESTKPHRTFYAATIMWVGILAAMLAAVCHETIGHSVGCTLADGHVRLLTAIFFRCSVVSPLSDVGGPIGNLVGGAVAVVCLTRTSKDTLPRLFLILLGCFNWFWFSAQIVHDALLNLDDWAFVGDLSQSEVWRSLAVALGASGYLATVRIGLYWLARSGPAIRRSIPLAYGSAAVSAVAAGLMWSPDPAAGAIDDFLTFAVVPLGLLVAWMVAAHLPQRDPAGATLRPSWTWIIVGVAVFGSFLLVQARGLGALAARGFLH